LGGIHGGWLEYGDEIKSWYNSLTPDKMVKNRTRRRGGYNPINDGCPYMALGWLDPDLNGDEYHALGLGFQMQQKGMYNMGLNISYQNERFTMSYNPLTDRSMDHFLGYTGRFDHKVHSDDLNKIFNMPGYQILGIESRTRKHAMPLYKAKYWEDWRGQGPRTKLYFHDYDDNRYIYDTRSPSGTQFEFWFLKFKF